MEILAELCTDTRRTLSRYLREGEPVALVDFPYHQNSGDSLIYLGERAHLKAMGVSVGYVCDLFRYNDKELRRRVPVGPILLHGGGNLGDRWVRHQEFREKVIADFPDRRIIQLPQSLEFNTADGILQAQRAFSNHPDLVLLLRDSRSLERAQQLFQENSVAFCPDMAFGVGPLKRVHHANVEMLLLLRKDSESVPRTFKTGSASTRQVDWGLEGNAAKVMRGLLLPGSFAQRVPRLVRTMYPALRSAHELMARLNVQDARRILADGLVVITDRLHAAVLAALSGISVVAVDNVSGKISAAYRDYLNGFTNLYFAEDETAAVARAFEILASPPKESKKPTS